MDVQLEVQSYAYSLYPEDQPVAEVILLFDVSHRVRGVLRFRDEKGDGEAAKHTGGAVYLWYRRALFPSIVDMLRNENPIYLLWDEASGQGYISTSTEPVGEGEHHNLTR